MKPLILKFDDLCQCPNCGAMMEDPVQDFCLHWKSLGSDSIGTPEDCYNCDKWFVVEKITDNEFEVRQGKY